MTHEIDGTALSLEAIAGVARRAEPARLAPAGRERIEQGRRSLAAASARGQALYGINTGFGDLANVRIPAEQLAELQIRLLRSHAAGVGNPLPEDVVRAMLLLRANALARGFSGVRVEVVETLLALLRGGVHPVVPSRGSVGASGDLAPLAHLALPLIGEGEVIVQGERLSGREGLRRAGLSPLVLGPKEGLALINGTQAMTAILALACTDARRLVQVADLVGALSTEALRGTDAAFDARIHALRPYPGQRRSAANLRRLLAGSAIRESHRFEDVRVQDPYSVRCMPQVHGAVRDVVEQAARAIEIEANSVTDNPLVFPDSDEVLSGGNFHGEPMAFAADFLAIALAELGSISERRIEKLTNPSFSGLPPFLVQNAGLNSGFMMAQVSAAALVSENKGLAHPASVDSIPTSADKEDHVSMGMTAALKLRRVVANVEAVLGIEAVAAAQGIDLLRPLRSSDFLETAHAAIRSRVAFWDTDREMAPALAAGRELIATQLAALAGELGLE
jgi:histidine ammonia-lyase